MRLLMDGCNCEHSTFPKRLRSMAINRTRLISELAKISSAPQPQLSSFVDALINEFGGGEQPLQFVDPVHRKGNVVTYTGGSGTISDTTNLLEGDGVGNASDSGIAASDVVQKQPAYPTPNNENDIVACLQTAGLCA